MKCWLSPSSNLLLLVWLLQAVAESDALAFASAAIAKLPAHLVDLADVDRLRSINQRGVRSVNWREPAAGPLLASLAKELGISERELGDLHFEDSIVSLHAVETEDWGDMAVLYFGAATVEVSASLPSSSSVEPGTSLHTSAESPTSARAGTLLLVQERAMLQNSAPCRLAWLRVRRPGVPRPFFDYYVASWIRENVISPHRNGGVQKFLSRHTQKPEYWNEFVWSFLGTFCSGLALMVPIIWQAIVFLRAMLDEQEADADSSPAKADQRYLLTSWPSGAKRDAPAPRAGQSAGALPTLLLSEGCGKGQRCDV